MTEPACLTLPEVATLRHCGYYCVLAAVTAGNLAAHHLPGHARKWYVHRADAEAWQPGRRGDPGPLLEWHKTQGHHVAGNGAQPRAAVLVLETGEALACEVATTENGALPAVADFGDWRARLDKRTPVYREEPRGRRNPSVG